MKTFWNMAKERELLAITYNSDAIFESESATLRPGALKGVGRAANTIGLFPDMAIHIEVTLDANGLEANSHLPQRRAQVVKNALLGKGIAGSRIRTTIHRAGTTSGSEDTISVKVIDRLTVPLNSAGTGFHDGDRYHYQTC